uniref:Uncharacterized protein n=1 Tax=Romanomermis culicivorax TaxID=13658 RepID=A0A915I8Q5_ROMCU
MELFSIVIIFTAVVVIIVRAFAFPDARITFADISHVAGFAHAAAQADERTNTGSCLRWAEFLTPDRRGASRKTFVTTALYGTRAKFNERQTPGSGVDIIPPHRVIVASGNEQAQICNSSRSISAKHCSPLSLLEIESTIE